jgi:hypothetical protein
MIPVTLQTPLLIGGNQVHGVHVALLNFELGYAIVDFRDQSGAAIAGTRQCVVLPAMPSFNDASVSELFTAELAKLVPPVAEEEPTNPEE